MMDGETFPNGGDPQPDPSDAIVAEVARILSEGGYAPMGGPPFTGLLCKAVGGGFWMGGVFDPIPGDVDSFHTHMAAPPRDPIEAAHWMVAKKRDKMRTLGMLADLTTQASLEPVSVAPEPEHDAGHETHGETGEEIALEPDHGFGGELAADDDDDGASDQLAELPEAGDAERGEPLADDGRGGGFSEAAPEPNAFLDADFGEPEELGAELLDTDYVRDPLLLEGEAAAEAAADEIHADPPQDRFYGLDDLDRRKTVAIGLVYRHAAALLEETRAGYSDAEHQAVRSHVVMNLNESGVYVGGDQGLFDRFVALDGVTHRLRLIEHTRDEKVAFIEAAGREVFESFAVEAGWP